MRKSALTPVDTMYIPSSLKIHDSVKTVPLCVFFSLFICRLVLFLPTATVCSSKNLVIPANRSERSLSLVLAYRLIILSIAVISQRLRFWGSTSSYLCGVFFPSYCSDPFFSYTKLNEVVMR